MIETKPQPQPESQAQEPIIECIDLHKSFAGHDVLAGVDCSIPEREISVIMGPSGTGKSVLLRHFVGLLVPDRGDVIVDDYCVVGREGRGRWLPRTSAGLQ